MLAYPYPTYIRPHLLAGPNPSHFTPSPPLPSATRALLRRLSVVSGMASSGSESFNSRSVDPELIPRGPEEEMAVRLALHRSRDEARARQRVDSFRWESIASAQMAHGSGARGVVAASPEAVRSA